MAKNFPTSQKHKKYNKNNIKQGGNVLTKTSRILDSLLFLINNEVKHLYALFLTYN